MSRRIFAGSWFATTLLALLFLNGHLYASEVLGPADKRVEIEVNKGRLVRLDRPASTVFIADPEIADIQVKSPTLIYVLAKKTGETTMFAVDAQEHVLASIDVSVIYNVERLREVVERLHPTEKVAISSVGGRLVLDGMVSDSSVAEDLRQLALGFVGSPAAIIDRLSISTSTQVNLRVRVAEISRGIDKQLGFNWTIATSVGGFAMRLATSNPFVAATVPNTLGIAGSLTKNLDLNTVIDALEQEGLVSVLAEPNLTAVSGEVASFLAGGEFPILVPNGNGQVTIEFKKFGVSLEFTPTVTGNDRISLHVRPEVSQLSSTNAVKLNNFQVPSITTRRAETTIELGSGQSFAVAGLIQNNVTHDLSKFPGLGDIPILGQLFRSDRFQRNETELVIIVTPYLVQPVNGRLAAPTDGFAPPNDRERIAIGGTSKQAAARGPATTVQGKPKLIGAVGFQLD